MFNINDIALIYNPTVFEYCVPRKTVEDALQGITFREKEPPYTQDEQERIKEDTQLIWNAVISNTRDTDTKVAIFTAGAPGSGKTTLINQLRDRNLPYIDFDDVALRGLKSTYVAENDPGTISYTKWRPASHYATHLITANLWRLGYSFIFGTTSTSPMTKFTYKQLKTLGYRLEIIHLSAPDQVRIDSVNKRNESWVQCTPGGTIAKGKLLPERINDTFLEFADKIDFYWRGDVNEDAQHAATWIRNEGIHIINPSLYHQTKELHNSQVRAMNRLDLLWENSVENLSH